MNPLSQTQAQISPELLQIAQNAIHDGVVDRGELRQLAHQAAEDGEISEQERAFISSLDQETLQASLNRLDLSNPNLARDFDFTQSVSFEHSSPDQDTEFAFKLAEISSQIRLDEEVNGGDLDVAFRMVAKQFASGESDIETIKENVLHYFDEHELVTLEKIGVFDPELYAPEHEALLSRELSRMQSYSLDRANQRLQARSAVMTQALRVDTLQAQVRRQEVNENPQRLQQIQSAVSQMQHRLESGDVSEAEASSFEAQLTELFTDVAHLPSDAAHTQALRQSLREIAVGVNEVLNQDEIQQIDQEISKLQGKMERARPGSRRMGRLNERVMELNTLRDRITRVTALTQEASVRSTVAMHEGSLQAEAKRQEKGLARQNVEDTFGGMLEGERLSRVRENYTGESYQGRAAQFLTSLGAEGELSSFIRGNYQSSVVSQAEFEQLLKEGNSSSTMVRMFMGFGSRGADGAMQLDSSAFEEISGFMDVLRDHEAGAEITAEQKAILHDFGLTLRGGSLVSLMTGNALSAEELNAIQRLGATLNSLAVNGPGVSQMEQAQMQIVLNLAGAVENLQAEHNAQMREALEALNSEIDSTQENIDTTQTNIASTRTKIEASESRFRTYQADADLIEDLASGALMEKFNGPDRQRYLPLLERYEIQPIRNEQGEITAFESEGQLLSEAELAARLRTMNQERLSDVQQERQELEADAARLEAQLTALQSQLDQLQQQRNNMQSMAQRSRELSELNAGVSGALTSMLNDPNVPPEMRAEAAERLRGLQQVEQEAVQLRSEANAAMERADEVYAQGQTVLDAGRQLSERLERQIEALRQLEAKLEGLNQQLQTLENSLKAQQEQQAQINALIAEANVLAEKVLAPEFETLDVDALIQEWQDILSETETLYSRWNHTQMTNQNIENQRLEAYAEQMLERTAYQIEFLENLSQERSEQLKSYLDRNVQQLIRGLEGLNGVPVQR